jgi:hypothetical protein
VIKDLKTPDLGTVCARCLLQPDHSEFADKCPGSHSGRHLIVRYQPWVQISFTTLFGIRSEERALQCFSEMCGGEGEFARRLTPEEFEAVRTGRARLVITVEPTRSTTAAP